MEEIHTAQQESEFRAEIPGQVHAEISYQATLSQEPQVDRLENTREPQPEVNTQILIGDIENFLGSAEYENSTSELRLSRLHEEANVPSPPESPFAYINADTPTVQIKVSQLDEKRFHLDRSFSELEGLIEEEIIIEINRETILNDMQRIYGTTELLNKKLKVCFIGEEGHDFGGLTKDLFSCFWNCAFTEWFKGEDALVPCIPLYHYHKAQEIFTVVGRVLSHMCQLNRCIPPRFCRSTLLSIVFNTSTIHNNILIDDFLLHVTASERILLKSN
ncbi:uncharacterized protein LOC120532058 [Polypterus senegalus]|uniref:uncharacterized protein LOC120532058 n=1 Tax=Polypterus senegalus TaxID=55291 RepID=UPI001962548F|nr:uncharacterized protein LOC120532058 [Polypterus senegalus]